MSEHRRCGELLYAYGTGKPGAVCTVPYGEAHRHDEPLHEALRRGTALRIAPLDTRGKMKP